MDFLNSLIPKDLGNLSTIVNNVTSQVSFINVKDKFLNAINSIKMSCLSSIEKQQAFITGLTLDSDLICDFVVGEDNDEPTDEFTGFFQHCTIMDNNDPKLLKLIQFFTEFGSKYPQGITLTNENGESVPIHINMDGVLSPFLFINSGKVYVWSGTDDTKPATVNDIILIDYSENMPVFTHKAFNNYFHTLNNKYELFTDFVLQQSNSLTLNTYVKDLCDTITSSPNNATAIIAQINSTLYDLDDDGKLFAQQLLNAMNNGGVMCLMKTICSLYAQTNSTEAQDEVFSFTNNAVYTPQSFLTGILSAAITSVVSIAAGILSYVWAPLAIVGSLIYQGITLLTNFFSQSDAQEYLSFDPSEDAFYDMLPSANYQQELSFTSLDEDFRNLVQLYPTGVRLLVPGGYIIIGITEYSSITGKPIMAGVEFHPYVSSTPDILSKSITSIVNSFIHITGRSSYGAFTRNSISFLISDKTAAETAYNSLMSMWNANFTAGCPLPDDETLDNGVDAKYYGYYYSNNDNIRRGIINNTSIFALWVLLYSMLYLNETWPYTYTSYFYSKFENPTTYPISYTDLYAALKNDQFGVEWIDTYTRPITWLGWSYYMVDQSQMYISGINTPNWTGNHALPNWEHILTNDAWSINYYNYIWLLMPDRYADATPYQSVPALGQPIPYNRNLKCVYKFPKYKAGSVLTGLITTIAIAATTVIVTAAVSVSVLMWRKRSRLQNQAACEAAWDNLKKDPSNPQLQKNYNKAVKKNNLLSHLNGGNKISKTNYWDSGSSASSGESTVSRVVAYATGGSSSSEITLDTIYHLIRG